jgi:hypothetical protein
MAACRGRMQRFRLIETTLIDMDLSSQHEGTLG